MGTTQSKPRHAPQSKGDDTTPTGGKRGLHITAPTTPRDGSSTSSGPSSTRSSQQRTSCFAGFPSSPHATTRHQAQQNEQGWHGSTASSATVGSSNTSNVILAAAAETAGAAEVVLATGLAPSVCSNGNGTAAVAPNNHSPPPTTTAPSSTSSPRSSSGSTSPRPGTTAFGIPRSNSNVSHTSSTVPSNWKWRDRTVWRVDSSSDASSFDSDDDDDDELAYSSNAALRRLSTPAHAAAAAAAAAASVGSSMGSSMVEGSSSSPFSTAADTWPLASTRIRLRQGVSNCSQGEGNGEDDGDDDDDDDESRSMPPTPASDASRNKQSKQSKRLPTLDTAASVRASFRSGPLSAVGEAQQAHDDAVGAELWQQYLSASPSTMSPGTGIGALGGHGCPMSLQSFRVKHGDERGHGLATAIEGQATASRPPSIAKRGSFRFVVGGHRAADSDEEDDDDADTTSPTKRHHDRRAKDGDADNVRPLNTWEALLGVNEVPHTPFCFFGTTDTVHSKRSGAGGGGGAGAGAGAGVWSRRPTMMLNRSMSVDVTSDLVYGSAGNLTNAPRRSLNPAMRAKWWERRAMSLDTAQGARSVAAPRRLSAASAAMVNATNTTATASTTSTANTTRSSTTSSTSTSTTTTTTTAATTTTKPHTRTTGVLRAAAQRLRSAFSMSSSTLVTAVYKADVGDEATSPSASSQDSQPLSDDDPHRSPASVVVVAHAHPHPRGLRRGVTLPATTEDGSPTNYAPKPLFTRSVSADEYGNQQQLHRHRHVHMHDSAV